MIGWARPVPYNPYNLRNQKWGSAIVGAAGPLSNIFLAVVFGLVVRFGYGTLPLAFIAISTTIASINVVLAVFNLVPIPPLDGSKVLFSALSYRWHRVQETLEQYGFIILIFFIMFLSPIIGIISEALFRLIVGA